MVPERDGGREHPLEGAAADRGPTRRQALGAPRRAARAVAPPLPLRVVAVAVAVAAALAAAGGQRPPRRLQRPRVRARPGAAQLDRLPQQQRALPRQPRAAADVGSLGERRQGVLRAGQRGEARGELRGDVDGEGAGAPAAEQRGGAGPAGRAGGAQRDAAAAAGDGAGLGQEGPHLVVGRARPRGAELGGEGAGVVVYRGEERQGGGRGGRGGRRRGRGSRRKRRRFSSSRRRRRRGFPSCSSSASRRRLPFLLLDPPPVLHGRLRGSRGRRSRCRTPCRRRRGRHGGRRPDLVGRRGSRRPRRRPHRSSNDLGGREPLERRALPRRVARRPRQVGCGSVVRRGVVGRSREQGGVPQRLGQAAVAPPPRRVVLGRGRGGSRRGRRDRGRRGGGQRRGGRVRCRCCCCCCRDVPRRVRAEVRVGRERHARGRGGQHAALGAAEQLRAELGREDRGVPGQERGPRGVRRGPAVSLSRCRCWRRRHGHEVAEGGCGGGRGRGQRAGGRGGRCRGVGGVGGGVGGGGSSPLRRNRGLGPLPLRRLESVKPRRKRVGVR